eukprot:15396615-Alexandrium_andersonii.AAC.1
MGKRPAKFRALFAAPVTSWAHAGAAQVPLALGPPRRRWAGIEPEQRLRPELSLHPRARRRARVALLDCFL